MKTRWTHVANGFTHCGSLDSREYATYQSFSQLCKNHFDRSECAFIRIATNKRAAHSLAASQRAVLLPSTNQRWVCGVGRPTGHRRRAVCPAAIQGRAAGLWPLRGRHPPTEWWQCGWETWDRLKQTSSVSPSFRVPYIDFFPTSEFTATMVSETPPGVLKELLEKTIKLILLFCNWRMNKLIKTLILNSDHRIVLHFQSVLLTVKIKFKMIWHAWDTYIAIPSVPKSGGFSLKPIENWSSSYI